VISVKNEINRLLGDTGQRSEKKDILAQVILS